MIEVAEQYRKRKITVQLIKDLLYTTTPEMAEALIAQVPQGECRSTFTRSLLVTYKNSKHDEKCLVIPTARFPQHDIEAQTCLLPLYSRFLIAIPFANYRLSAGMQHWLHPFSIYFFITT